MSTVVMHSYVLSVLISSKINLVLTTMNLGHLNMHLTTMNLGHLNMHLTAAILSIFSLCVILCCQQDNFPSFYMAGTHEFYFIVC